MTSNLTENGGIELITMNIFLVCILMGCSVLQLQASAPTPTSIPTYDYTDGDLRTLYNLDPEPTFSVDTHPKTISVGDIQDLLAWLFNRRDLKAGEIIIVGFISTHLGTLSTEQSTLKSVRDQLQTMKNEAVLRDLNVKFDQSMSCPVIFPPIPVTIPSTQEEKK